MKSVPRRAAAISVVVSNAMSEMETVLRAEAALATTFRVSGYGREMRLVFALKAQAARG